MEEGVYAYHIEYKTMMTMLLSSSSSLVYLHRMLATSLTATCSCLPVESFTVLRPWVCMSLSFVGTGDIVIHGRWSFHSHCGWYSWLLGGQCHLLGAGHHLLLAVCFACGCQLGSCCLLCSHVCLWQKAMWRAHLLLLTLVMWLCDCHVWLSGGHHGLWAARDVHCGGCYMYSGTQMKCN